MIQVWMYDKNNVFTESTFVEEVMKNMTTTPLLVGYVKPTFTGREWIEGATDEEIKEWQETNKPNSQPQNEMEVLQAQINELKIENQKLWDTCNYLINVNLDLQETINNSSTSSVLSKTRNKK